MKKNEMVCVALIVLCIPCIRIAAQDTFMSFDDVIEEILMSDDESGENSSGLYEHLADLYSTKVNLNSRNLDDLELLPFLTSEQIENIGMYAYLNGGIKDISELQLIDGMDYHTRQLLECFVYAGNYRTGRDRVNFGNIAEYGRHELSFKSSIPLYVRDGFKYHSPEELRKYPNRQYYGNRCAHSLRYQFRFFDRIKVGITADQDAGDPFFGPNRWGYDFYSPYIMINDVGRIQSLIAGNMKVGFGQGLLLGSGFSVGKSMLSSTLNRQQNSIKVHSGTSEYGYFTGTGVVLQFGKYYLSAVLSRTMRDATLSSDGTMKSLKKDGYHRTLLEYSKRHNVVEDMAAMHLMRSHDGINVGATFMYDDFSRGERLFSYSADYSVKRGRYSTGGEIAYSYEGFAMTDNITWKISERTMLTALYRYGQDGFRSYHSMTPTDGEKTATRGLYLGMKTEINYYTLSGYIDGRECQFESLYYRQRTDKFLLRLKYRNKDDDRTLRLKFRYDHNQDGFHSMQSQLNCVSFFPSEGGVSLGASVSHVSDFSFKDGKLKLSASACGFITEDYDSRISIYEKGLLYSFGYLTLYGKGVRSSILLKYRLSDALALTFKAGSTKYFDREEISSSQQRISADHKEDIEFQIRLKL